MQMDIAFYEDVSEGLTLRKNELLTLFETNCDLGKRMESTVPDHIIIIMVWTDVSSIQWLSQTWFESENVSSTPFVFPSAKV